MHLILMRNVENIWRNKFIYRLDNLPDILKTPINVIEYKKITNHVILMVKPFEIVLETRNEVNSK